MSHVIPMRRTSGRRLRIAAAIKQQVPRSPRRPPSVRAIVRQIGRALWSGWFAGKALAVALLLAGAWVATEAMGAPSLQVRSILVSGNELVPAEEVLSLLPPMQMNVFLVRGPRLALWLQADPAIAEARIVPRMSGLVDVLVRERRPTVVWQSGLGPVLVDREGLVLRPGARALPTVQAPESALPSPGERVPVAAVRVAETVALQAQGLGLADSVIEFRPAAGVTVQVPGRYRVVVGQADQLERQLAAYDTVRRHLEQRRTVAQVIDVRSPDRPFFR